jgi:hypothetical protein
MTETSDVVKMFILGVSAGSAIAMRRLYAMFLLAVAIYFLVAPQGASKSRPRAPAGLEQTQDNPG